MDSFRTDTVTFASPSSFILFPDTDKKLDSHDQKLDTHDQKFDAQDQRLDAHDEKMAEVDKKLASLEQHANGMGSDNERFIKSELRKRGRNSIDQTAADDLLQSKRFKSLRGLKQVAARAGIPYAKDLK